MASRRIWQILALALIAGSLAVAMTGCGHNLNRWPIVNCPPGDGPIVCFGDSLVAGVGAETETERYPSQLQAVLGRPVVSIGTSGQTSEEGLRALQTNSDLRGAVVIVTLGGNDILRQVRLAKTEECLGLIFAELQKRGAMVAFTAVEGLMSGGRGKRYQALCRQHGVVLVPDVLGRILPHESLRSDQIHPNAAGYQLMAQQVADTVRPFLSAPETK